jgi:hypothetical protein
MSYENAVTQDISSLIDTMNKEDVTSIDFSVQYQVNWKPVTLGLHELSCSDEMTINEFVERKVVEEEQYYAGNFRINDADDVESLGFSNFDQVSDLVRHLEDEVKEPNLSVTVNFVAEMILHITLQTLEEWNEKTTHQYTLSDVLEDELHQSIGKVKYRNSLKEWEVL